jgi:hypothetical protein
MPYFITERKGRCCRGRAFVELSRAGLLAPGSSYWPRLPILPDSGIRAVVVTGYSGGSATVLHRFPYQGVIAARAVNLLRLPDLVKRDSAIGNSFSIVIIDNYPPLFLK